MDKKLWLGMDMSRSINDLHNEYVSKSKVLLNVFDINKNSRLQ